MKDPIINSFVQEYLQNYELESEEKYTDFERFSSYCVFSSFNRTGEEFEVSKVHTGGSRDTGLDGIGILIDDILVDSQEEAENIIGDNKKRILRLSFIFVQAKLKNSFEFSVVQNTINAVEDFFADYREEEPIYSRSERVKAKALLASYLLKTYIHNLREKPRCNIYYICTSSKEADSTIKNKQSRLIKKLEEKTRFLSNISFEFWGSDNIEKLYRQTKLQVEAVIQVHKSFSLTITDPKVKKVYMTAISFPEFKKIILQDRKIRDFIFYDNVRGFLGEENKINEAIQKTLKSEEEITLFPLLNNGVTIITKELNIMDENK
ncbi:MAG: AIPR family protein [Cyanobacteria bacterium SBLK]|nr:AIPR family protein [Cyanobacteria bacterium SBLK]